MFFEECFSKRKCFLLLEILKLLEEQDMYGYQMIAELEKKLDSTFSMKEGTLYPILRRLESGQLLTVRTAEHNGRLRKYYHITQLGLERIEAFRNEWKEILSIYKFVTKEDGNE